MALLPDLASAALYGLAAFLLILGMLVVFVESIRLPRFLAALVSDLAIAVVLVISGEPGVAIIALGVGGALMANQVFEWLTTR